MSRKETKTNRITVVMSDPMREKVDALAEKHDRTVSDFVRLMIKDYLEAIEGGTQVVLDSESRP